MIRIKKIGLGLLGLLLLLVIGALIWSSLPVQIDRDKPDPTVIFANNQSNQGPKFTESYFEFSGNNLHYVEAGEGDVVLFLHGFPSFWYSLIRPMQALKRQYRVVAIDGIGKGKSDVPKDLEDYELKNMVEHIHGLIDHLGVEKVHVVGHDWGHALAFALAQRYPERIKSVVGMSAPPATVMLELIATNGAQREIFSYVDYFKKAHPILLAALDVETKIWQGSFEPLVKAGQLSPQEGDFFAMNRKIQKGFMPT
jgi:pimeloyl-ACP methyl ester carboxylesterase